jgi:hypothetical protein
MWWNYEKTSFLAESAYTFHANCTFAALCKGDVNRASHTAVASLMAKMEMMVSS